LPHHPVIAAQLVSGTGASRNSLIIETCIETALTFRTTTPPAFLLVAGIPQGPSQKLEEDSGVPLHLPYQS
jgi:hypothetical protein